MKSREHANRNILFLFLLCCLEFCLGWKFDLDRGKEASIERRNSLPKFRRFGVTLVDSSTDARYAVVTRGSISAQMSVFEISSNVLSSVVSSFMVLLSKLGCMNWEKNVWHPLGWVHWSMMTLAIFKASWFGIRCALAQNDSNIRITLAKKNKKRGSQYLSQCAGRVNLWWLVALGINGYIAHITHDEKPTLQFLG